MVLAAVAGSVWLAPLVIIIAILLIRLGEIFLFEGGDVSVEAVALATSIVYLESGTFIYAALALGLVATIVSMRASVVKKRELDPISFAHEVRRYAHRSVVLCSMNIGLLAYLHYSAHSAKSTPTLAFLILSVCGGFGALSSWHSARQLTGTA